MIAGFWHTNFWPRRFWHTPFDIWQDYAEEDAGGYRDRYNGVSWSRRGRYL